MLLLLGNPSRADQCPSLLEHPGAAGVTDGADSRAGELATSTVVVLPGFTFSLGLSGVAREQGHHRANSSY